MENAGLCAGRIKSAKTGWIEIGEGGGVKGVTNIYLYILPLNQYLQFKNHPLPYPPMKLLLIQSPSARRVTAHKAAS